MGLSSQKIGETFSGRQGMIEFQLASHLIITLSLKYDVDHLLFTLYRHEIVSIHKRGLHRLLQFSEQSII